MAQEFIKNRQYIKSACKFRFFGDVFSLGSAFFAHDAPVGEAVCESVQNSSHVGGGKRHLY